MREQQISAATVAIALALLSLARADELWMGRQSTDFLESHSRT
jgi:hypothetical protein